MDRRFQKRMERYLSLRVRDCSASISSLDLKSGLIFGESSADGPRLSGPARNALILSGIRESRMSQTYTAVIKQQAECWIGWIEEVPGVNCQEETREELAEALHERLAEALGLSAK
jgi:hypothetical protein